ncbi:Dyp-type peroxidase [Flexivirga caeni]|uniref:Dyp-type peroxidase n=1 Tax=Flexivirga caeni TaxID=2294115 RepID=A0A3M9MCJ8_9MICO|nr:Dyp-type peroxidase [Flexivirga caeni]RNI23292.1 Dyp-type peroxidase [Flexivirga caeni]
MPNLSRRTMLLRAGLATGGAGAAAALAACPAHATPSATNPQLPSGPVSGDHPIGKAGGGNPWRPILPFHGAHQTAVLGDPLPEATIVSFDLLVSNKAELTGLLRTLTEHVRALIGGGVPTPAGIAGTDGSGILGPSAPRHALEAILAFGPGVFTEKFGLADAKPRRLRPMDTFPNDQLDPAWCGGDLLLTLQGYERDVVTNALRDVCRATRGGMQIRWKQDGFTSSPKPAGHPRNLLGFKDGIAGPDTGNAAQVGELVWAGAGEPSWAAGGTYYVMRRIRMLVEFWDRVSTSEQERMFGRRKDSGAPLTGGGEESLPNYSNDPNGNAIPLDSHIRVANPRTPETANSQFLRRGYSYDAGVDAVGNLDMGLMFGGFNADLDRQFVAVQKRLVDEPLVDYITPVGGSYFFAPPGVRDTTDFYGSALLA